MQVQTGLERLLKNPHPWVDGARIGLLCNPASVDGTFRHARDLIHTRFKGSLKALFSPQHGFYAEKQDNMIESEHIIDPVLNIPVFSLYGRTRRPTAEMFDPIDLLVVDLQDVGTRVYTFIYTLSFCMEAAREYDKKVLVLDRPNPVNGVTIEGNCLTADCTSFVGRFPLPMRHGLTIAELARLFNDHFGIGCTLDIVPMYGWRRQMYHTDTGRPWISPSPNLPTPMSAMVYPGQVLWEGTNVSEGRGTTLPFEVFGAPFLDTKKMQAAMPDPNQSGVFFRPLVFEPTANKWEGQPCPGFQIHLLDRNRFKPYLTSLALLQSVVRLHPDSFKWKPPPYEYEFERYPIDLIIGDHDIRRRIENLENISEIEASWQPMLKAFIKLSRQYHLYLT